MKYVYITCPCGDIRGVGREEYTHFKGVRYATAERWEAPVQVKSWDGCFDATVQGAVCPQHDAYISTKTAVALVYYNDNVEKTVYRYSEDCLNLNIYVPTYAVEEQGTLKDKLPVLVYFHGGSYNTGSGANPNFHGAGYCKRGVILIDVNYRLNAFASAYGDGITGNFGLLDQICALNWIRDNIEAFGGDADNINIMGESAGAMSVQHLIYAPKAKGLFKRAIMLSGGGNLPKHFRVRTPELAEEFWKKMKEGFKVTAIQELRQFPAEDIYLAWDRLMASELKYGYISMPVANGDSIPALPEELTAAGRVNAVPCIISITARDMFVKSLYDTAVEWALAMEEQPLAPTYGQFFSRAVSGCPYGAFHGGDTKYAFGTLDQCSRAVNTDDYRISDEILDRYAAFVKTGRPDIPGKAKWQPISGEDRRFMNFNENPSEMIDVPEAELQAFEDLKKPFPGM